MEKNNVVEFKETVELFVNNTIPHIKSNTEVPNINFVFKEEAFELFKNTMEHPFESPRELIPNIRQEDIDNLKQMTSFNDELPNIIVHDHNLFFKYLTDITNSFITLHKKYNIDFSARERHIRILRRIWLRMGPDDFNQVELFLKSCVQLYD